MRITVLGATGNIGRRVVREALLRGHKVTAAARSATGASRLPARMSTHLLNVADSREVATICKGQDVVVNATRPSGGQEQDIALNTHGLNAGLTGSTARLLVVGGAASLVVPGSGGKTVLEDPRYLAPALRHIGQASLEQYEIYRGVSHLDWVYLCPPADIYPGSRTGSYRLGRDELLLDEQGRSHISMEDFAVALLDEVESPRHHQQRFTVAY